jgi:hypothetical protein
MGGPPQNHNNMKGEGKGGEGNNMKGEGNSMSKGEGKGKSGNNNCSNCGGRGHFARDCPSKKECSCCGSWDHYKADCPDKDKQCDICFKIGHLKIKCIQALTKGLINMTKGMGGKGEEEI